ncbi:hypothetical protein CDAR_126801 [Caerostris darwini]|uniref:Uncharacterized protein n=1 Tax=Caerostris darwini TaxID=1538125 RepID=A0AAV4RBL2_9ARAC|nr:hypothetical protein CDAR_126801 [Caerostris darwini]
MKKNAILGLDRNSHGMSRRGVIKEQTKNVSRKNVLQLEVIIINTVVTHNGGVQFRKIRDASFAMIIHILLEIVQNKNLNLIELIESRILNGEERELNEMKAADKQKIRSQLDDG